MMLILQAELMLETMEAVLTILVALLLATVELIIK